MPMNITAQLPSNLQKTPGSRSCFYVLLVIILLTMAIDGYAEIPLQVKESMGIARANEMVHNGIPVAREEGWLSTDNLVVENASGSQIPATFEVLSRWAGGKDDITKPIQWLLVSFPATIGASQTVQYYVKTGTPIAPTVTVSLASDSGSYTIDTGPAQFVINKTSLTLFDSIYQGGSQVLVGNGGSHATVDGQLEGAALSPRKIIIERQNSLYLVIKIEGDYANTPIGTSPNDAPVSYKIRYEFFAGSPTAIVTHKFFWAGSGSDSSNGRPSESYYFTMDNVSLSLPDMENYSSVDVYADSGTYLIGGTPQSASIKQRRKDLFSDPHRAELMNGSAIANTEFASQPMLLNRSSNGTIGVSIDHMKYFEPQSIETGADGKIKVNVMAGQQYFADYQGTWARVGISALPLGASYEEALQYNYAPLNQRLFAFPVNSYTVATGVFEEMSITPDSTCVEPATQSSTPQQSLQCYYDRIREVTDETKLFLEDHVKNDGEESDFRGLMTWGSMTGYRAITGDGEAWDKIYSGAWNTDYQNAWNNVNFQFALEGDSSVLYDLSFMAARRMLHTQIIQPDWENSGYFMGWGYAGYHYYRSDPNASHSYFENLLNYYYLTGDMEVIDIVKVGAATKREDFTRDSQGNLNDPQTGGVDWVDRVDRRGMQAAKMFQFVGHTYDTDYLDDFKHVFTQAFTRSLVLLQDNTGVEYGFLSTNQETISGFSSEQVWMVSLYFLNYLYQMYSEFGDVTFMVDGNALTITRIYKAVANGFMRYINPANNGWDQQWYNQFTVNYTGDKIGGTIASIDGTNTSGNPLIMYNSGKFPVITAFLRAGKISNNNNLTQFGIDGIQWALNYHEYNDLEEELWGKVSGIIMTRFHHALAYLQNITITTPSPLPHVKRGTDYSKLLTAVGGTPPYRDWHIISGTLPGGLILNPDSGEITGMPTTNGIYTFTVQVADSSSPVANASATLSLTVGRAGFNLLYFLPGMLSTNTTERGLIR